MAIVAIALNLVLKKDLVSASRTCFNRGMLWTKAQGFKQ